MITFPQPLADAYVLPSRNISMPSTPGRTVRFLQGHAVIKNGSDLVALMRRPDVKLVMTPYSLSWLEEWLAKAGTGVRAEIMVPETALALRPTGWEPPPTEETTSGSDGTDANQGTV